MTRVEMAPILSLKELSQNAFSGKVVLVGGTFDIFHTEHIDQLKEAADMGDILIVHVTGDDRVREKKGNGRPIFSETSRARIIASIRFVDYVFIYNGRHYDQQVIDCIQPNVLCFHRDDYTDEVRRRVESLERFEGKVALTKHRQTINSTDILAKIKNT